jgi:hypothetical protein
MSSNYPYLDTIATRRILAAIIEQSYHDCSSSNAAERAEALGFFFKPIFKSICLGLELNDRRIRIMAGKAFTKAEKKHEKNNTRTDHREKRERKQTPNEQLGEVQGELRLDLSEVPTHLL